MSGDAKDPGVLSRWAQRKADVEREAALDSATSDADELTAEPEVEPDDEEAAMDVLRERDPELAEQIAGIDIDKLAFEDDFTIFMNKKVPEFIRRRALSKLWLLSPVLANVDGLNDYDEDFTAAADALRVFKSAYIPGKGYPSAEPDEIEELEDAEELADGEAGVDVATDENAVSGDEDQVSDADPEDDTDQDGGVQLDSA